jgi:hypothetical protein
MDNTCGKCKFWQLGECLNPEVKEKLFMYDYQIVFPPTFGCIFWAGKPGK